jgi:hypothetical protein
MTSARVARHEALVLGLCEGPRGLGGARPAEVRAPWAVGSFRRAFILFYFILLWIIRTKYSKARLNGPAADG